MDESRSSAVLLRMPADGEAWLGLGAYLAHGLMGDTLTDTWFRVRLPDGWARGTTGSGG